RDPTDLLPLQAGADQGRALRSLDPRRPHSLRSRSGSNRGRQDLALARATEPACLGRLVGWVLFGARRRGAPRRGVAGGDPRLVVASCWRWRPCIAEAFWAAHA